MKSAMLLALLFASGTAQAAPGPAVSTELQRAVDETVVRHPDIPSLSLTIIAPRQGLNWTGFAGRNAFKGKTLSAPPSFRVASVTKVFVAASILRLMEQGKLSLSDPVSRWAAPATIAQLRNDGYDPDHILIRHLLEHSSGIFNYAMAPAFHERLKREPRHRWTPREQIGLAMAVGQPLGAPGKAYHYSDTGYVILGEIIERVTQMPMAAAIRRLARFKDLGLRSTWFETLEAIPPSAPPRAHQYWVGLDTTDWDPSFDLFGGGGIVSTTPDLATFFRSLLMGRLFSRPETTLAGLAASPSIQRPEGSVAHAPLLYTTMVGDEVCWSHGGFFGTLAAYCPSSDTSIAVAVNMNSGGKGDSIRELTDQVGLILAHHSARDTK